MKKIHFNGVLKREHLLAAVKYENGNARAVGKRIGLKSPGNVALYTRGNRKKRAIPTAWYHPFRNSYGALLFGAKTGATTDVRQVTLHVPSHPKTARDHALYALKASLERKQAAARRRREARDRSILKPLTGEELRSKPAKDGMLRPGEYVWTSPARNEYVASLTLEQIQRIRVIEAFDPDEPGNQRALKMAKVRAICKIMLEQPWSMFPAPLIGETSSGVINIDGNHRIQGQAMAAIENPEIAAQGFLVRVVITSVANCKQLFNLHGTTATRIPSEVCLANGDGVDTCATHIMNAVRNYGAKPTQPLTLFHGVVCGNGSPSGTGYFSFMPGSTPLPSWAPETADIALDAWSDNELWEGVRWGSFKQGRSGSGYSGTGTMRVIGALARDYMSRSRKERGRLRKALKYLGQPKFWAVGGVLQVLYSSALGVVGRNAQVMRGLLDAADLAPSQGWRYKPTKKDESVALTTEQIGDLKRIVEKELAR